MKKAFVVGSPKSLSNLTASAPPAFSKKMLACRLKVSLATSIMTLRKFLAISKTRS